MTSQAARNMIAPSSMTGDRRLPERKRECAEANIGFTWTERGWVDSHWQRCEDGARRGPLTDACMARPSFWRAGAHERPTTLTGCRQRWRSGPRIEMGTFGPVTAMLRLSVLL